MLVFVVPTLLCPRLLVCHRPGQVVRTPLMNSIKSVKYIEGKETCRELRLFSCSVISWWCERLNHKGRVYIFSNTQIVRKNFFLKKKKDDNRHRDAGKNYCEKMIANTVILQTVVTSESNNRHNRSFHDLHFGSLQFATAEHPWTVVSFMAIL